MTFLIDFDGTCTTHDFPRVGKDIGAQRVLKRMVDNGHKLILFTMRCNHDFVPNSSDKRITNIQGNFLDDAVNWFKENNIPLYGIQKDPRQHTWTSSPKAYANFIIDDTAIGMPTLIDSNGKEYVDWMAVEAILENKGILVK